MRRTCISVIVMLAAQSAAAQTATCNDFGHFDIFIDVAQNEPTAPQLAPRRDNPTDPTFIFPLEVASRQLLVPADFGDFGGGPHKTDDPGWVIDPGDFEADDVLWFRALGTLSYFDPVTDRWLDAPPAGERVRFFGAIPPDVFISGDPDELDFYRQGTIWSGDTLTGPTESAIEQAAADGSIHSHLDFCVEDSSGDCSLPGIGHTGNPSVGAYLIELELFSDALDHADQQRYRTADPVKVILNHGLVADECTAAIEALSHRPTDETPEPTPASGVLILGGE